MENSEYATAESERPDLLARWQPEPEQQTPRKQLAVRQDGGVTDRFTDDPYLNWLRVGWVIVSSSLTECGWKVRMAMSCHFLIERLSPLMLISRGVEVIIC
jgi:hypothetical protein